MNYSKLFNPERGQNLEGSEFERGARKAGGYLLALTGYGFGAVALFTAGATAGLSLPVFGALSAASYAGSRVLMRPAFQNDEAYEAVQNEPAKEKWKRYGAYGLGIAAINIGANLFVGGLFNIFPESINAFWRTASVVGGLALTGTAAKAVEGSFDPGLFEERRDTQLAVV